MTCNKNIDNILAHLKYKITGDDKWQCICPSHDDKKASLSIIIEGNTILMICRAGCETENVLAAIGLKMKDLFIDQNNNGKFSIVEEYDYLDLDGKLIFQTIRSANKKFLQRRPDNNGGWIWNLKDITPLPYRLPSVVEAVKTGNNIFIVEGEKDVHSLEKLGITATTNPMGAGNWKNQYDRHFNGANVIIIPDNDDPGKKHANQIASSINDIVESLKILELPGLKPKGDITDWINAGGTKECLNELVNKCKTKLFIDTKNCGKTSEDLKKVISNTNWLDPLPVNNTSLLPDFPIDALPEFGKDIVNSIVEVVQVDPSIPGSILLSILSMALGKKIIVNLVSHEEPVNLYLCSVAGSGERKSPTVKILTAPITKYQKELQEQFKVEDSKTKNEISNYKKQIKELEKNDSNLDNNDGLNLTSQKINTLKQKISDTPLLLKPTLLADDITPEALGILMANNNELMSIISPEGGGLFGILAGIYSDKGCNIDLFLKAHSGEYWSVHRVNRQSQSMDYPILTLGLTVQPIVLDEIKMNRQFNGRGLLSRFLYSYCKPKTGYRKRQNKPIPEDIINKYEQRVSELVKIPLSKNPEELKLSEEAQKTWNDFYDENEISMQLGNSFNLLQDWGSKLPGTAARIAGLLHYAKKKNTIIDTIIPNETVEKAITIAKYYRDHAYYVFGILGSVTTITVAEKILEYIDECEPESFKVRDLIRHKNYLKNTDQINPGIELLINKRILKKIETSTNTGGRPEANTYLVNPKYKYPENH